MTAFPHMSSALPQLATPDEVAEYLGRETISIVRLCRRGDLPAVKVGGRWLIHLERLAEYIDQATSVPVRKGHPASSDNHADPGSGGTRRQGLPVRPAGGISPDHPAHGAVTPGSAATSATDGRRGPGGRGSVERGD